MPKNAFLAICQFCGQTFLSKNQRRIYCSTRCRRGAQNERRADERAEEREARLASADPWEDPWARNDLDNWEEIFGNALLDAAPVWSDNPWGGPQVDMPEKAAPHKAMRRKMRNGNWLMLPGMELWLS